MMLRVRFALFFLWLITTGSFSQVRNGEELIKQMHQKYYQAPCKVYSFSQNNSHYRNDSLIKTSVWHEVIEFPGKFRIDFGNKTEGNYVIFRNDSAINYRNGKFLKSRSDSNSLLLILGGMYYRELNEVLYRLKRAGYNTQIISEQNFNNATVYVLGALKNDSTSNQLWIDPFSLRVLRIIERRKGGEMMDLRFEAHQTWCRGYVETKVSFRSNGKLEQVEEYYDLKTEAKFPD